MVDVLDRTFPAETVEPAEPQSPAVDEPLRRDARWIPYFVVAFAVGFSALMLRQELSSQPYANDAMWHSSMVRFAEQQIRAGHNPFASWYPYLGLGGPQFAQYQALPHFITGLLSIAFGSATFAFVHYALMVTWPITVYAGARLLGLDRAQAAGAALFSPMLSNVSGYGFEWGSFMWLGTGLWSMLWGLWLLPITLGLAFRAIVHREHIALAVFVFGLNCALHFVMGFFAILALGVFVLVHRSGFIMRLGRAALVGVGGLATFAFVFGPMLANTRYTNVSAFAVGTFWINSFGPGQVLAWLFHGEIFDYGQFPVVSLAVALGASVALVRSRRDETARACVGLMVLALLLYSGRRVVGPVINYLPGGANLPLHRYVAAVHLAGLMLAGIGSAWLVRTTADRARRIGWLDRHALVPAAVIALAGVLVVMPLLLSRQEMASTDTYFMARQRVADVRDGRDMNALLDIVRQRNDGRVYAGALLHWGMFVRSYQLPLYSFPVQHDVDSLGLSQRTASLSTDIEVYFDDTVPAQYDMFGIRYVLLPSKQKLPAPEGATVVASQGRYTLYEVPTSGYLDVVDTTAAIRADNADMAAVMKPYLRSSLVGEKRHPLVAFDGAHTPTPSIDANAPDTGPPGTVDSASQDLMTARFSGRVHADRAAWVMLKETYDPDWTATVDGKPVPTSMLAPSFVGVPVPAGDHTVAFAYRSSARYPTLVVFGGLTLLVVACGPLVWRRVLRSRRTQVTTT